MSECGGMSVNQRPFLPAELRGVIGWKPLAAALGRHPQHVYRLVAAAIALLVVLLATQPRAAEQLLAYCRRQAEAWRESEVRALLAQRYGVPLERLERSE